MQNARIAAAMLVLMAPLRALAFQTADGASSDKPVKAIASRMIEVAAPRGSGNLPLYVSVDGVSIDPSQPQPAVTRALIVFHGKQRNADDYNESGLRAVRAAGEAGKGTLLITPQFLQSIDVEQFRLPGNVLRWPPQAWMGGGDAIGTPVSSFDAIDQILLQLASKKIFPNLTRVVVAGHSGGGQVVQRYAVVGKAGDTLVRAGIHVRYVIANPSSYVYFSPDRPALNPRGDFTFATPVKSCYGRYDKWKYGIVNPPQYAAGENFQALEQHYLHSDIVYLLGTDDTDPNHPALDKSCSAEDEGAYRFFRGKAYFRYLELRHPELEQASASQQLWYVPGVGHDGDKMLNSACGLAALFDKGPCRTRSLVPKP